LKNGRWFQLPAPYCGNLPPLHQKNKVISLEREIRNLPFSFHDLKTAEKRESQLGGTLKAKVFIDTT
jgi:hypothetical protein